MLQSIPFYKWCVPPSLSPLRVAFRPNMSDHDPNDLNWDLGAYDECLDQLVDARDVGDRLRYLWSLRRANSWACMASSLVSAQFQTLALLLYIVAISLSKVLRITVLRCVFLAQLSSVALVLFRSSAAPDFSTCFSNQNSSMGSVGPNYRCPLCGRVGNGGYAPDGIDFPICTEGDFSCLWFQTGTARDIIAKALGKILERKRPPVPPKTIHIIASFLTPEPI